MIGPVLALDQLQLVRRVIARSSTSKQTSRPRSPWPTAVPVRRSFD